MKKIYYLVATATLSLTLLGFSFHQDKTKDIAFYSDEIEALATDNKYGDYNSGSPYTVLCNGDVIIDNINHTIMYKNSTNKTQWGSIQNTCTGTEGVCVISTNASKEDETNLLSWMSSISSLAPIIELIANILR
ncbi:MAG: hypothetical protein J6Q08_03275 [Bacteroidaceae bacterium]|nr:hypothetical protein [Bacteroidaceae bacterium]